MASKLAAALSQPILSEEDMLQQMSPVDALKLSTQLQNKRVYSPEEASANLKQIGADILYASPLGNALSARDAMESKWAAQEAEKRGDPEAARQAYANSAASAGMAFLPGMGRLGVGPAANSAAKEGKSTLAAIMAYHGSPHDFDRFDMSKASAVSGRESYGYGHNFAEDPATARSYMGDKGHLYKTELDVEPHQLLDWDKPLSEQSPEVRKALETIAHKPKPHYDFEGNLKSPDDLTGETYYQGLAQTLGRPFDPSNLRMSEWANHEAATQALREAGIPGLRYRGAEGGTHNFVIFDDKLAKILGKE